MGAYLSSPVTKKEQESGSMDWLRYGSTSMQGWRTNQEDAHNCIVDNDRNFGFFAVYDGHGGAEVAAYAAQILPDLLRNQPLWKDGNIGEALQKTFLDFDKLLLEESAINEMRRIKDRLEGTKPKKNIAMDEDELFEEAVALSQEANISIEELMAQYVGIRKKLLQRVEKRERNGEESPYEKKIKRAKIVEEDSEAEDGKFSGDELNGDTDNGKVGIPNLEADLDARVAADIKKETKCESNHEPTHSTPDDPTLGNGEVHTSSENEPTLPSDLEPPKLEDSQTVETTVVKTDVSITLVNEVTDETPDIPTAKLKRNHIREASGTTDANEEKPGTASAASNQPSVGSTQVSSSDEDEDYEEEEDDEGETDEDEEESDEDEYLLAMDGGMEASTPGVDSGTTACVVALFKNNVIVANVGDSRAVLSRNGVALDLSVDHKPEDEIEKNRILKAGGQISEDGRVNGGLNLSRALGDHYYKTNKTIQLEDQMISPLPDIVTQEITSEDKFLVVACDGIWNSMSSQQVIDFVQERLESKPLEEIGAEICDKCCAPDTSGDGTGCDNMTVIIVDLTMAKQNLQQPVAADEPPADPSI